MTIAPGASLSGNASYTLNEEGRFVNNGILAPGNSLGPINISGAYQQGIPGSCCWKSTGAAGMILCEWTVTHNLTVN
ncbi:hypothetical protein ACLB6M_22245 [Enterobacter hormaechei]